MCFNTLSTQKNQKQKINRYLNKQHIINKWQSLYLLYKYLSILLSYTHRTIFCVVLFNNKINFQSVTNGDFQSFIMVLSFFHNIKHEKTFKLPKKFVVNKRKLDFSFFRFLQTARKNKIKALRENSLNRYIFRVLVLCVCVFVCVYNGKFNSVEETEIKPQMNKHFNTCFWCNYVHFLCSTSVKENVVPAGNLLLLKWIFRIFIQQYL